MPQCLTPEFLKTFFHIWFLKTGRYPWHHDQDRWPPLDTYAMMGRRHVITVTASALINEDAAGRRNTGGRVQSLRVKEETEPETYLPAMQQLIQKFTEVLNQTASHFATELHSQQSVPEKEMRPYIKYQLRNVEAFFEASTANLARIEHDLLYTAEPNLAKGHKPFLHLNLDHRTTAPRKIPWPFDQKRETYAEEQLSEEETA